jgi:hypothetical protein
MRYSKNLVWKSVYVLCPEFEIVRTNGISVNLPASLRDAAVVAFIECESTDYKLHKNKPIAGHIVREALKELHNRGEMAFGTIEDFWM